MSTKMDTILLRLAMDHQDIEISGMAGEFCAHWVFDKAEVAWIDLGQAPNHHSTVLKASKANRPDYLVMWGGASVLVDVKTYRTLDRRDDGARRFGLVDIDWHELQKIAQISGLAVAIMFWDKLENGRFCFGICLIDELKTDYIDDEHRKWKCIDFAAGDMTTLTP